MKGMNRMYDMYPCPYYLNPLMYNLYGMYNPCKTNPHPYWVNTPMYNPYLLQQFANQYPTFTDDMEYPSRSDLFESEQDAAMVKLKDYGPKPFVINIDEATKRNNNFRTALWTGANLQVTLMSINVGEDIGLEVHKEGDQFIRIEEGEGLVEMGDSKHTLDFKRKVYDDFSIMIPAGKWHNIINSGNKPLKLYAIYAPPEHPYGTVHETKAIAEAAEKD